MRLYEFEGKELLKKHGIAVPDGVRIKRADTPSVASLFPAVAKAQTLFGNRKEKGLIQFVEDSKQLALVAKKLLQASEQIIVEEQVSFDQEYYIGLRYDTTVRSAVLEYALEGGTGIEARAGRMKKILVSQYALAKTPRDFPFDTSVVSSLLSAFFDNDCVLLEINPLVKTRDGHWMALDAKVELDDTASFRHPEWEAYPARTLFSRKPTAMEEKAKEINAMDHRGVAGASFFEFDGTIGVLASGGGASGVAMDGLIASGLHPANYTEYSGNPTRDKVKALAKLVLSKKGLEGLWVVGGNANFTDIYETLSGVMDAIEEANVPTGFPVVIRRGGPRWQEAFDSIRIRMRNTHASIQLFGPEFPMLETTSVLVTAVQKYRGKGIAG